MKKIKFLNSQSWLEEEIDYEGSRMCFIRRRRFDLIRCNSRKLDYSFPRVVNRTTITEQFSLSNFKLSHFFIASNESPKSFKFLRIIFPKIPSNIFNLFNIVGLLFLSYLLQFSRNSSSFLILVSIPRTLSILHPGTRYLYRLVAEKTVSISRKNGVTFQTGSY